jgi:hypothetical protein
MTLVQALPRGVPTGKIATTWWPLAASWLLMSAELPAFIAVVSRLPDAQINLAAYGGIVFPLALIVESGIIMLLAASTALSKDWESYRKIYRWMMTAGALLTAVHLLVAFTPLYYVIARQVIGAPEAILEAGRTGLMIMTPWTWSIAYRRFNQGVMIRAGKSQAVGIGTIVRLASNALVLLGGFWIGTLPGIVVGASATATGVVMEAIYSGIAVQPALRDVVKPAPAVDPPLTFGVFLAFYLPLALTSFIVLLGQPIGSAALSRMPMPIISLAVWPAITSLSFIMRSPGIAYNEVVVALIEKPGAWHNLRRFAMIMIAATTGLIALVTFTPLAWIWFRQISGLSEEMASLAANNMWLAVPIPAMAILQSWYQGAIVYSKKTRGITESVVLFLITAIVVYVLGVWWGKATGVYVGMLAFLLSNLAQTVWLWFRSRPIMATLSGRLSPQDR